jgi:CRISPR-associated exonuclease Cas4
VALTDLMAVALVLVGLVVLTLGVRPLVARRRERRLGTLVAIDPGRPLTLRSDRYRIAGRPDVLRRTPDGTVVPIELKHRPLPPGGAFRSHLVQVWAYCLLVEEATGRSPPFGILRYTDGEVRVPWDPAARAELRSIVRAVRGPYDGRGTPSPGRCARCGWADRCELRARPG